MSKREEYHTKQKELILNVIKNLNHEFTVKEIYDELKASTGLTTIYRVIDKLVEEGCIEKTVGDKTTYYQYLEKCDCDNHYYLKCINCGKLIHVDCDCINELSSHILKKHGFVTTKDHIILQGTCKRCIER